jgi:lysine 2,3-aminomutase
VLLHPEVNYYAAMVAPVKGVDHTIKRRKAALLLPSLPVSERHPYYESVSDSDWSDWRWQLRQRVETVEELREIIELTDDELTACEETASRFRMAVTPYYLSLVDPHDPSCPIRRQAIPVSDESRVRDGELADPLDEEGHMLAPGLTHRYPDRALLYTTHNCAMYCRFCTRKRKVSDPETAPSRSELSRALDAIAHTPAIRDVIISGGDPLSLSNNRLSWILSRLTDIPHVQIARIGTRNLVTLPQRIDDGFCDMLREQQSRRLSIYVMTHFNHPRECTDAAWTACERITATGTPILNQMVLLHGINDSAETVAELNRRLLTMRVKPYYMLHADMAEGIGHFRTSVQRGIDIIGRLRGFMSGLAIPHFVVDLPGGGGKVSLDPDYVDSRSDGKWYFKNYQKRLFTLADAPD